MARRRQVANCTKRLGDSDSPAVPDILDSLSGDRLFALVRLVNIR